MTIRLTAIAGRPFPVRSVARISPACGGDRLLTADEWKMSSVVIMERINVTSNDARRRACKLSMATVLGLLCVEAAVAARTDALHLRPGYRIEPATCLPIRRMSGLH